MLLLRFSQNLNVIDQLIIYLMKIVFGRIHLNALSIFYKTIS